MLPHAHICRLAYEVYRKYLGLDDIGNFQNAVEFPLMAYRQGIQIARIPLKHNEDGSLEFLAEMIEGEKNR